MNTIYINYRIIKSIIEKNYYNKRNNLLLILNIKLLNNFTPKNVNTTFQVVFTTKFKRN